MKAAFADTSAVLAVLFREPGWEGVRGFFGKIDRLFASNLLEAEVRSAALREGLEGGTLAPAFSRLQWVMPDRPLSRELEVVSRTGIPLRGADLWHVACALYLAGDPRHLTFVTLDRAQAGAAEALGFTVFPHSGKSAGASETPAAYRAKRTKGKNNKGKS